MVLRQVRNPPPTPGQRRYRAFTMVTAAIFTYIVFFWAPFDQLNSPQSYIGKVRQEHKKFLYNFFGTKPIPASVEATITHNVPKDNSRL